MHGVACDVTADRTPSRTCSTRPRPLAGPLDVVVNNAGLGGSAPLVDMTDEQWRRVLDVSLVSTFRGTRAALRRIAAPGPGGPIVNVASVTGWRAEAGQAHYAAAKAGVMALTRSAAIEAAPHGVRGRTRWPRPWPCTRSSRRWSARRSSPTGPTVQPQGRAADPAEVAAVIAVLASGYASYLTGEVVSVGAQHP